MKNKIPDPLKAHFLSYLGVIRKTILGAFLLALGTVAPHLEAGYVFRDGRFINVKNHANLSAQEHFSLGTEAFKASNWKEAISQFRMVTYSFPGSPFAQEAAYYLGVSFYKSGEPDLANEALTLYLKGQDHPKHFEEAIQYKFEIAEKFREGTKRHILGYEQLPKWASGKRLGTEIYEEIITTLPSHEIAAKALFAKSVLLEDMQDYKGSVDCLQMLIRRFPKHELAAESYLRINHVYQLRSESEYQNPDLISLAEINLKRFKAHFPSDSRTEEVAKGLLKIKEVYAQGLYDTGRFYERTKKPTASALYYKNTISQFPETAVAKSCEERLKSLGGAVDKAILPGEAQLEIAEGSKTPNQDVN